MGDEDDKARNRRAILIFVGVLLAIALGFLRSKTPKPTPPVLPPIKVGDSYDSLRIYDPDKKLQDQLDAVPSAIPPETEDEEPQPPK